MNSLESFFVINKIKFNTFTKFLNQILINLINPNPNNDYSYLYEEIEKTFDINKIIKEWSNYLLRVYDLEELDSTSIEDLDHEKKEFLIDFLKTNSKIIKNFLLHLVLNKEYKNLVNEFDWKVNLVLATDEINNISKPFVNIIFTNSDNKEICNLELNENELDLLIKKLDDIQIEIKSMIN